MKKNTLQLFFFLFLVCLFFFSSSQRVIIATKFLNLIESKVCRFLIKKIFKIVRCWSTLHFRLCPLVHLSWELMMVRFSRQLKPLLKHFYNWFHFHLFQDLYIARGIFPPTKRHWVWEALFLASSRLLPPRNQFNVLIKRVSVKN